MRVIVNYPKVSIITLNWNSLKHTLECLESLKKIIYPNYEVIVVDNGSKGNDANILREKFNDFIQVITNDKNYGFCGGNNIGIKYALEKGTDYVLLLNNDTIVDPEFLNELIKAAEEEKIGLAQPKIYKYDQREKLDLNENGLLTIISFYFGLARIGFFFRKNNFEKIKKITCVSFCCALIKKNVFDNVGLLDEVYFIGGYDSLDFSCRAIKSGFKIIYCPKSKIWHKGSGSSDINSPIIWHDRVKNRIYFARKNFHVIEYILFLILFLILYIPKLLLQITFINKKISLLLPIIKGIYDGFKVDITMAKKKK